MKDQLETMMMMIIFWDEDDVLLTEYLPGGTTINGSSDSSIIEGLRSVIAEKGLGKVSSGVLLLHDNAPIDKCNIVSGCYSTDWLHRIESLGLFYRYCTD